MNARATTSAPSALDRARALVARRGGSTQAQTLRGAIAALRRTVGRPHVPAAAPAAAPRIRVLSLAEARRAFAAPWQGRARIDTISPDSLVDMALDVHRTGERHGIAGRAVPNSYKGDAGTSVAWAEVRGRVVVVAYARTSARHCSYGTGGTPASHAGAPKLAIRRQDLHALLVEREGARLARALDRSVAA